MAVKGELCSVCQRNVVVDSGEVLVDGQVVGRQAYPLTMDLPGPCITVSEHLVDGKYPLVTKRGCLAASKFEEV